MKTTVKSKKNSGKFLALAGVLFASAFLLMTIPAHAAEVDSEDTTASVSFIAGELKLESVPVFYFGEHPISNDVQIYDAESVAPNVRISDLRGSGQGWDLNVALSPFTAEDNVTQTLQGSQIDLNSPVVNAVNGTIGAPPAAQTAIVLSSDGTEAPVLSAGVDAGMGVWELFWSQPNATLTVLPGTAQDGVSTANLNWSLQSAP